MLTRGLDFRQLYISGIPVPSIAKEEHLKDLRIIVQHLNDFGRVINTTKWVFGDHKLLFLGRPINADDIHPQRLLDGNIKEKAEFGRISEAEAF